MRVRLSARGVELLKDASAYREFVVGRPSFEVESYDGCYLHRETGCTFSDVEVEPAADTGPMEEQVSA